MIEAHSSMSVRERNEELASLAGVVGTGGGAMIQLEQRGAVAIVCMAAALWIMLLIAAWGYLF
jgi:hypothetical protein